MKRSRTFEMLTVAFVGSTMTRTQVQLWNKRFKKAEKISMPGRPCISTIDENIEAVKKMILDNR